MSVFHISGTGNVGTGTIRGLPELARFQEAGAAIWPFDGAQADGPTVIEIYPRVFYGMGVNKGNSDDRRDYLEEEYAGLEGEWRGMMIASDDAFDAGVSALVMSAHAEDIQRLQREGQEPTSMEGKIWVP